MLRKANYLLLIVDQVNVHTNEWCLSAGKKMNMFMKMSNCPLVVLCGESVQVVISEFILCYMLHLKYIFAKTKSTNDDISLICDFSWSHSEHMQ